ncbi:thioredoxin reductase [Pseudoclavibacter chungangensis]|uniref:FAD-binding protein n=1 Tax=Pseudoclavibacter chungangensis TaxID=587635 RepID=UPI0017BB30C3|nr:FAD-binding protein [Pseudoclavibacter chungangensis]NYJ68095.1 thioredoxin reductase [Pseudoclavibacter chungangensis]
MTQNDAPTLHDTIVIGGGAAGLSAALMLGRARRDTLVIDVGSPRNRFADHMHGVLGNEGTPPDELLRRGREEAAGYGVRTIPGTVATVTDVRAASRWASPTATSSARVRSSSRRA